ncbi:MAG: histidinol-phosphate transaminase [Nitrospirae bacterium]|nr:histidinol-phosphate transaminase [Nitrospirota bacterium]
MDFSVLTKKNIRSLKPYKAEELPCAVKLDANESPYCINSKLSPEILEKLNRYPDPDANLLKTAIAKDLGINKENILLGNGSDELIYYLIITFGGPVLAPVPTFSMYAIISQALGEKFIGIPLDKEFDIDTDKMIAAIKKYKPKLIFLSSPNNPTGNCFSADRILKIIEASRNIVIVDEAYQPFASEQGFLPFLNDYANLAIMRTLSKIGLAALRTGFMIADRLLIDEVNKVRLPFNLNSISQAIALDAFKQKKAIICAVKSISTERDRLTKVLAEMKGVTPYPSEANFILFAVENADLIYKKLLKSGVLVRNLSGVVKNSLRVTVGTPDENNMFIKSLERALRRNI